MTTPQTDDARREVDRLLASLTRRDMARLAAWLLEAYPHAGDMRDRLRLRGMIEIARFEDVLYHREDD